MKWLSKQKKRLDHLPKTDSISQEIVDSVDAKICPESAQIMQRYRVGHDFSFYLDRSPLGSIWFDKGDILIGSSLVGIIASEIANRIELKHLILVGSAKHPREVNSFLKLVHPMIDYIPITLVKALAGKIPFDLCVMFSKSDLRFIKAMPKAIFTWEGLQKNIKVTTRIHGVQDLVISKPEDSDFDIDGGHLIAMTNPEDCLKVLRKFI